MTAPRPAPIQPLESAGARTCRLAVLALLGTVLAGLPVFFSIQTYDQFELPKVVAMRCLTALMLGLWALRVALEGRLDWKRTPLDLPVLAWTLWLLVKTLHSISPSISWRGEYENFAGSLTQANYGLLFFIAVQHVRQRRQAEALTFAFLAGAVAAAVYALMQALGLDFIGWTADSVIQRRYFSSLGNPNFLGGLVIMALPLAAAFPFSRPGRGRLWLTALVQVAAGCLWAGMYLFYPPGRALDLGTVFSTSDSPVLFIAGLYLAALAAQAILLLSNKPAAARVTAAAGLGLLLFDTLLNTGTRGAFLGFLAMVVLLGMAVLKQGPPLKKSWIAGVLVAGLALASFALGPELSRRMVESFRHPYQAADMSRLQIWGPALKMWKAHPLTGTGVDTFKTAFPRFSSSKFTDYDGANVSSRTAHSEPLQILATLGLVGLGLWGWLLATWAMAWWKKIKAGRRDDYGLWLAALGAAAGAYLTQNLVSFGVTSISAPFWIMLALLWAEAGDAPAPPASARRPVIHFLARAGLAAGALIMVWKGLPAAVSTYAADRAYNQGHILTSQAQAMESASLEEARNYAGYCLDQLSRRLPLPDPLVADEAQALMETLRSAESYRQQDPGRPELRGVYIGTARRLLNLYSAVRQQEAVDLCPGEVKYYVYLGLSQEELFKMGRQSPRAEGWFKAAEGSYRASVRLNPWNGYYWGNLGRLNGLRVEPGNSPFLAEAESHYKKAISQAPVTQLFYQNLMQLEALAGRPGEVSALAEGNLADDPRFTGSLQGTAGRILWQVSQKLEAQDRKLALVYRDEALRCLEKASALRPEDAAIAANLAAVKGRKP